MRYLVTGAAGFIGSHLTRALLAAGHDVVAVDCFTDYYPLETKEENAAGIDILRVDLADGDLDALLVDIDGVFHLAAQPGVRGSWGETFALYLRDNVLVTQRLLEAAAGRGLRVVFSSSSSVYGNASSYPVAEDAATRPASPYGVTKLACEQLADTYRTCFGLDIVSLRYFTVFGPHQRPDMSFTRIAAALASGTTYEIYGDGLQSRDFTYVDDAVAANVLAMKSAPTGAVYNVGGGSEATLLDTIAMIESIAGRSLAVGFTRPAAGDARRTAADTRRIRGELGWRPTVSLKDGLARQWAWYVDRPAPPAQAGVAAA